MWKIILILSSLLITISEMPKTKYKKNTITIEKINFNKGHSTIECTSKRPLFSLFGEELDIFEETSCIKLININPQLYHIETREKNPINTLGTRNIIDQEAKKILMNKIEEYQKKMLTQKKIIEKSLYSNRLANITIYTNN